MVSQRIIEHITTEGCSYNDYLLCLLFKILLFIYDVISYIPYKLTADPQKRLEEFKRKKAAPIVPGNPGSPWTQCYVNENDMKDELQKCQTLGEVWDKSVKKYADLDCMGTRKFIASSKELQKDGRAFEKLELGPYQWKTFSEVDDRISALSKGLRDIGHRPSERILIYSETREEFAVTMFTCFKTRAPVVTVYTTLGVDALAHSINECSPITVFTTAKLLNTIAVAIKGNQSVKNIVYFSHRDPMAEVELPKDLRNSKLQIMPYEKLLEVGAESDEEVHIKVTRDDVAMIMYTSGTTAAPKGVILLQKNLMAAVKAHSERIPLSFGDSYLGYLPLAHIFEVCAELTIFSCGLKVGYATPLTIFDGAPGLKKGQSGDVSILKPTFFVGTPAIFNRLVQAINDSVAKSAPWKKIFFETVHKHLRERYEQGYNDVLLNSIVFHSIQKIIGGKVKFLLSAGAAMNPDTHSFIRICMGCIFGHGYGATETSGSGVVAGSDMPRSDDLGQPQIGFQILLREWAEGGYSPRNARPQGEILIGGDNVAAGYLNNEEQTKESFIEMYGRRWFATGDIGEFRENGALCVIDRKKDLLKLAQGEYISLGKVESYLATMSFVDNICVCGNSLKDYIVAVIVPRREQLFSIANSLGIYETNYEKLCANVEVKKKLIEDMQSHCKGKLNKMEIPRKVYLCHELWTPDSGLVTAAFKIKRKVIEDRYKSEIQSMYAAN